MNFNWRGGWGRPIGRVLIYMTFVLIIAIVLGRLLSGCAVAPGAIAEPASGITRVEFAQDNSVCYYMDSVFADGTRQLALSCIYKGGP